MHDKNHDNIKETQNGPFPQGYLYSNANCALSDESFETEKIESATKNARKAHDSFLKFRSRCF